MAVDGVGSRSYDELPDLDGTGCNFADFFFVRSSTDSLLAHHSFDFFDFQDEQHSWAGSFDDQLILIISLKQLDG